MYTNPIVANPTMILWTRNLTGLFPFLKIRRFMDEAVVITMMISCDCKLRQDTECHSSHCKQRSGTNWSQIDESQKKMLTREGGRWVFWRAPVSLGQKRFRRPHWSPIPFVIACYLILFLENAPS
jgi:hypothetical protein